MAKPKLKIDQICTAQFTGTNGNTSYMVIGLGEDGSVYRYEKGLNGWVALNMEVVPKPEREPRYTPPPNSNFNGGEDDDIPF